MKPDATAGYDEHDTQRCIAEPEHGDAATAQRSDAFGSPFAVDRFRVLRSAALRTLGGKTQSLDLDEGQAARVRLTHSLEVAQISRMIGESLGADPLLAETAGLAHDLGHPPFGHNGEAALDQIAQECGGFEGNAQTLRILTRLAPGPHTAGGLNLTRALLDAACKYPWTRKPGAGKFGVYDDDAPLFAWMRDGCPGRRPCLEAQVMDWADDVACAVSDLEDGIRAHHIRLIVMADRHERAALAQLASERLTTQPAATVEAAATELMHLPLMTALLRHGYDGTPGAQAALGHLTEDLIGRFTQAAVSQTRRAHGDGRLTRYRADLTVPQWACAQVAWLKALTLHYVLRQPSRRNRRRRQKEMLTELFHALHHHAPDSLAPAYAGAWRAAGTDTARVRAVVDHIASLTEPQAIEQYHRLLAPDPPEPVVSRHARQRPRSFTDSQVRNPPTTPHKPIPASGLHRDNNGRAHGP
jgi:dGTPase